MSKATQASELWTNLRIYQNTARIPKTTASSPLLTLRTVAALFEDPVGVLVLLVGAEVPLADDADVVALDVDELDSDLLVDVWLVAEVSDLVVVELVSVEEEEEVAEEVELEVVVGEADGEELADVTELEPSTVMLSL